MISATLIFLSLPAAAQRAFLVMASDGGFNHDSVMLADENGGQIIIEDKGVRRTNLDWGRDEDGRAFVIFGDWLYTGDDWESLRKTARIPEIKGYNGFAKLYMKDDRVPLVLVSAYEHEEDTLKYDSITQAKGSTRIINKIYRLEGNELVFQEEKSVEGFPTAELYYTPSFDIAAIESYAGFKSPGWNIESYGCEEKFEKRLRARFGPHASVRGCIE